MRWLIMLVMYWENNKGYFEKKSEESNRFSDWIFTPIDFFFIAEKSLIYLIKYMGNQRPNLFFLIGYMVFQKLRTSSEKLRISFYFFWEIGMNYAWQINFWFFLSLIWDIQNHSDFFWLLLFFSYLFVFSVRSQKCS